MQYLKVPLKYIGCRLMFVLVSFCLAGPLVGVSEKIGLWFFSFSICIIYWPIVFDMAWKVGKFDAKPYTGVEPRLHKGFTLGIISEIPAFLLLLLAFLYSTTSLAKIFNVIYVMGYCFPYLGFMGQTTSVTIWYLPILFAVPVVSGIGYILGVRGYKVLDKLPNIMYKKDK